MRQEGVADGTTRRGYGTYIRASLSSVGKAILQNTRRMCTKALNQTLGAARTMGMSVNRRKGRVVQRATVFAAKAASKLKPPQDASSISAHLLLK